MAAAMCLFGLPGYRFLLSTDREEQLLLAAMLRRAGHWQELLHRDLAVRISNQVVKAIR